MPQLKKTSILTLFVIVAAVVAGQIAVALQNDEKKQEPNPKFTDQQIEFFENKVRPLLVAHCFECHGPDADDFEGGLNLTSRNAVLAGGDSGPAIISGEPDESLLVESIRYDGLYDMPPDSRLSDEAIEVIEEWVKMGAPWPKQTDAPVVKAESFDIEKLKKEHWCWRPVQTPAVPDVANSDWPRDPIDNFILSKLESKGLPPAEPATKRELIRRVYFDLLGLPPSPAQVDAFVHDSSATAFETVVDELLSSKHFGEKWARHWMDLTRYAETCGHEFDYPIPDAWQYRDYLIRAFNADVPYNQFVTEHIAGDLIENPRRHTSENFNESVLGTGFWFLHEATHGPVDSKGDQAGRIDNQIDVMSKTFLGLTVSCARCHDHKFDAISEKDYYSLVGFLLSSHRQQIMLDPNEEIKTAFDVTFPLVREGDQEIAAIYKDMETAVPDRFSKYLQSAWKVMRSDAEWSRIPGQIIESDGFTVVGKPNGVTQQQELKPQGGFTWRKNHQFWWRDSEIGDQLTLEFVVPKNEKTQQFKLHANFTTANDFGAAKISLDGIALKPNMDFYNPTLAQTGKIELGRLELTPGKHKLAFQITGHHEKAITRHMIGIDYLELEPILPLESDETASIESEANSNELEPALLERVVKAIKSDRLNSDTHPLHILQQISRRSFEIKKESFSALREQLNSDKVSSTKANAESKLFADFHDGIPSNWSATGFALKDTERAGNPKLSPVGNLVSDEGIVNSGRFGSRFEGVLRSPTFTIEHDQIHYRICGSDTTIRLIIDGFVLDEYNALLFNGMKKNVNHPHGFTWLEQANDLKNHIGRLAHIEIIDHGDGWFMLDEIRFSNQGRLKDDPRAAHLKFSETINELKVYTQQSVGHTISNGIASVLRSKDSKERSAFVSWVAEHDLISLFAPVARKTSSRISNAIDGETFVTLNGDSPTKRVKLNSLKQKIIESSNKAPRTKKAPGMIDGSSVNENVFIRGNHKSVGPIAERRFLSALVGDVPMKVETGSGRLKLAEQIVDTSNPLTRRVIVNRIWHHLTGRGIVPSVDNFGVLGQKPSNPDLLDFLAEEFSNKGWSMKRFIKRIVLTQTYQMSSRPNPNARQIDPDNILLHRARVRRLSGESIRDSILQVSGTLDPKMFGAPVPIHLTPFMQGRGRPGKAARSMVKVVAVFTSRFDEIFCLP